MTSVGSAIGVASSIIAAPVISRLYTPEQYGIFSVCLTIISFIVQNGMFRFEDSLFLEENEANINAMCQISFAFAGFSIILSSIALTFWGKQIFTVFNIGYLPALVFFIIAASFISMLNRVQQVRCMRRQQYKKAAIATTASSVFNSINQVGFGFFINNPGLFIADLLARVMETFILFFKPKRAKAAIREKPQHFLSLIKKYQKFIIYLFPQNLLVFFTLNLPTLAISNMFGQAVNGNFQLANKMVMYPIGFLTGAISSVFLAEGAKIKRESPDQLLNLIKITVLTLMLFSIPVSLLLGLFGDKLALIIFGPEWSLAGKFCRYMLPMYLTGFWISPLAHIFVIIERQELMLFYNALRILCVIALWGICLKLKIDVMLYIFFYSSVMAVNYLVMLYTIVKTTKITIDRQIKK